MELFLSSREYDILRDIRTLCHIFSKLEDYRNYVQKMYFINTF